jgi:hypothetical protein
MLPIREGVKWYDNASVAARTRHLKEYVDLRQPALRIVALTMLPGLVMDGISFDGRVCS